ncbi:hypothetical protein Q3G72_035418 [Acer saccharum]|nr:hypothetical protein Q3G72_035418 [Acer saccharum]
MKTIESWNMMNYHQSRRGRLRGRWEPWYYDFYNYLKDGFISEYATRGQRRAWRRTCPTICDLGRCPLQKVLQGRWLDVVARPITPLLLVSDRHLFFHRRPAGIEREGAEATRPIGRGAEGWRDSWQRIDGGSER